LNCYFGLVVVEVAQHDTTYILHFYWLIAFVEASSELLAFQQLNALCIVSYPINFLFFSPTTNQPEKPIRLLKRKQVASKRAKEFQLDDQLLPYRAGRELMTDSCSLFFCCARLFPSFCFHFGANFAAF
jgi:hypothetical protein